MGDEENRHKAVKEVNSLYKDFISRFNHTDCKTLTACDFTNPEDRARYMEKEIYKNTCFVFFNFVMKRFMDMENVK